MFNIYYKNLNKNRDLICNIQIINNKYLLVSKININMLVISDLNI